MFDDFMMEDAINIFYEGKKKENNEDEVKYSPQKMTLEIGKKKFEVRFTYVGPAPKDPKNAEAMRRNAINIEKKGPKFGDKLAKMIIHTFKTECEHDNKLDKETCAKYCKNIENYITPTVISILNPERQGDDLSDNYDSQEDARIYFSRKIPKVSPNRIYIELSKGRISACTLG